MQLQAPFPAQPPSGADVVRWMLRLEVGDLLTLDEQRALAVAVWSSRCAHAATLRHAQGDGAAAHTSAPA